MELQLFATMNPSGQQAAAPSSGSPFLPFSRPVPQEMSGSPSGFATSQQYVFESQAGLEGLGEAIALVVSLNVTPTIATGNSIKYSPLRSFIPRIQLSQGGQVFRDIHPFFYSLRRAVMRRMQHINFLNTQVGEDFGTNQYMAANLPPSSLPALVTATAAQVTFVYMIPLRWLRATAAGMFPVGDTTTPLRLSVFTPVNLVGNDPEANPFLIHPGSSDTVAINSGSIKALLWYRTPLVYAAKGKVATPVVGTQLMHVSNSQAMTSVGGDNILSHKNLYPHTMLFTLAEDGNADPNVATSTLGMLNAANVARYRFRLTETDPVDDLDTADKILLWMLGWNTQLDFPMPDGVWPYIPWLGEAGSGLYVDQNLETMYQFPSFQVWQNAQTILNLAGGTTLNGAGAGLSRLTEWAEYLVSVPY